MNSTADFNDDEWDWGMKGVRKITNETVWVDGWQEGLAGRLAEWLAEGMLGLCCEHRGFE